MHEYLWTGEQPKEVCCMNMSNLLHVLCFYSVSVPNSIHILSIFTVHSTITLQRDIKDPYLGQKLKTVLSDWSEISFFGSGEFLSWDGCRENIWNLNNVLISLTLLWTNSETSAANRSVVYSSSGMWVDLVFMSPDPLIIISLIIWIQWDYWGLSVLSALT